MKALFKLKVLESSLFKNGIWGIVANVLQTVFVSGFFVILARNYSREDFAEFLVASTIYQMIVAFSTMGLGQWFIREYNQSDNKEALTGKFVKLQLFLGLIFYLINVFLAFIIYPNGQTQILCIILGSNIIFDNVIYAIRNLNVASFTQKKTFIVLSIDGFLRVLLGCIVIVFPFSILTMSVLLIAVRFLTVNLFLQLAWGNSLSLRAVVKTKLLWADFKTQLLNNWQFVVIGSITIIYWRTANVIIAKVLTLGDVANYEIAFRILSIVMILPSVASSTVYAQFVKLIHAGNKARQTHFYNQLFLLYTLYSFLSYGVMFLFSETILVNIFGAEYRDASVVMQEMFLTILLFPTVLLQANAIIAMKYEKVDMWLNISSLVIYLLGCAVGFYYVKSLSVINHSIFVSFLIFHILQNVFLISKGMVMIKDAILFYILLAVVILSFQFGGDHLDKYVTALLFILLTGSVFGYAFLKMRKSVSDSSKNIAEVSIL